MIARLTPPAFCDRDLVIFDEVDSTNDALRRLLRERDGGSEGGGEGEDAKAVLAYRQTAGRGRLGRTWVSPAGGLYFSVALDVTGAGEAEPALSLVVAIALRRALVEQESEEGSEAPDAKATDAADETEDKALHIKWPNDLVCSQGKLAGILIETFQATPRERVAIVGIGINVQRVRDETCETATYLSDLFDVSMHSLEELALSSLHHVYACYTMWATAGFCFNPFCKEYEAHLALRDAEVRVSDRDGKVLAQGVLLGVDQSARLLIRGVNGSEYAVSAGEVTLR